MTELVGWMTAALLVAVAAFQGALAAGAPLGAYAWGGQNTGPLPRRLRIASAAATPVYIGIAILVLDVAGVLSVVATPLDTRLLTAVAAVLGVGVLANAASRSRQERIVWTPIVAALFVGVLIVLVAN